MTPRGRVRSVDALRGATILAMILVNNPGSWASVYWPLAHAEWNGCTPTDLVFPFFLFLVGVSIVLALGRRVEAGIGRRALVGKIVRRAAVLFGLGLFLNGYPFGLFGPRDLGELIATWRFAGVLQRIAVCYLAAALMFVFVRRRALAWWTGGLLVGYWLLLAGVPVPDDGYGAAGGALLAPDLASHGQHLAGWVDRTVLGDHVWSLGVVYDPEGILSTLPALATTLLGVFAGLILTADRSAPAAPESTITTSASSSPPAAATTARLFAFGTLLAAGGYVWSWFLPLNKALWTSSYAVFTAGMAALALALLHWWLDLPGDAGREPWWARALGVWSVNAITVFFGSVLVAKTLLYVSVGVGDSERTLYTAIHQWLFASWLPPYPASLGFALGWVGVWGAVLAGMYRRGWVLKV